MRSNFRSPHVLCGVILMRKAGLFVEDFGHETVLNSLLLRFSSQYGIPIDISPRSVRGGHGRVITELRQYIRDIRRDREPLPDLLIVATDANCKGFVKRRQEIEEATEGFADRLIPAIPDPHIERWLLLDSGAFKAVLGKGCAAPDLKCERDRYKRLLQDAVRNAGLTPLLGGMEHAEALVAVMDLVRLEYADESLGSLLKALRDKFQEWEHSSMKINKIL